MNSGRKVVREQETKNSSGQKNEKGNYFPPQFPLKTSREFDRVLNARYPEDYRWMIQKNKACKIPVIEVDKTIIRDRVQKQMVQARKNLKLFKNDPSIIKQWDKQTIRQKQNINITAEYETQDPQQLEQIRQFSKALNQHLEQQHQRKMEQIRKQGKEQLKRRRRKIPKSIFTKQFWNRLVLGVDDENNSSVEIEEEEQDLSIQNVDQIIEKARTKVIKTGKVTYIINAQPTFGFIDGTNIPRKPVWQENL